MSTLTGRKGEHRVYSHPRRVSWPSVLLLVGVVISGIFAPVMAVAMAALGVASKSRRGAAAAGTLVVFITASVLAWMNSNKAITGDWFWYVEHYKLLSYLPLNEYLGSSVGGIHIKPTEPVYYSIASFVSTITGANIAALAWAVTLLVYLPVGIAALLFTRAMSDRPLDVIAAVIAAMLTGLTFTLSTQLVRQEIAAALVCLAIVLLGGRRNKLGWALLVLACLTHNSAIIPAVAILIAMLFSRRSSASWRLLVLVGLGFAGLGYIYVSWIGAEAYRGASNGSISPIVIAFDIALAVTFAVTVFRNGETRVARLLMFALPAIYGFVAGVASEPLPFLRMYFYIEVFRALMVAYLVVCILRSRLRILVAAVVICVSVLYVEARIFSSPFEYDGGLVEHLLFSPFLGEL